MKCIFFFSLFVELFFCPKDILKLKWVNITIQQKYFPGEHKKLLWNIKNQIIFEEKELGFFAFFIYNTSNLCNISSTYSVKITCLSIKSITTIIRLYRHRLHKILKCHLYNKIRDLYPYCKKLINVFVIVSDEINYEQNRRY